jgi:quinoprotein glucose dehydrogenase
MRLSILLALICISPSTLAQSTSDIVDWPNFGNDLASTRYSPLAQIDQDTVDDLEVAWRWTVPDAEIIQQTNVRSGQFKATPIMVRGVLYTSTPMNQIAAIDSRNGETLWVHDPGAYERGIPANSGFQHRGVAYWTDGSDERIIIATGTRQLIALNARTGKPYLEFGTDGWVDLGKGYGREFNERQLGFNSPPIIVRDTIVLGSVISDGPRTLRMPPGDIRGFDVRTGKQKWIFHTVPHEGEPGVETWLDDSWKYTGNTNAWGPLSADEELGYVYVPVGTPTNDYYGGHRRGDNLYAESLLCLNAENGEKVWHFQGVHHGLWDYDFCAAPNLIDIVVDGRKIKAVAQVSKQNFTYVFDRATGKPVWPIEERAVPQTRVPGEWTSPTQPFPTKPPAFDLQGVTEEMANDLTPELNAEAIEIMNQYEMGPLFLPPSMSGENGKKGAFSMPGGGGGANWAGAAVDPDTGLLYVHSNTIPRVLAIDKADPDRTQFNFVRVQPAYVSGPQGLPLIKPPWGRITAIDLNKGEIEWQVAHGDGMRDHSSIAHLQLNSLGNPGHRGLSSGGPLVTKTLLFYTQSPRAPDSLEPMSSEYYIRAFNKSNGFLVWEHKMEIAPHGSPMTYQIDGQQFIVTAAGGYGRRAELVAFALPN